VIYRLSHASKKKPNLVCFFMLLFTSLVGLLSLSIDWWDSDQGWGPDMGGCWHGESGLIESELNNNLKVS
jgi:hypothetical protein